MAVHIRRREFITLGGAAAGWPLAARAQQATMPVIGFLNAVARRGATVVAAFRQGLRKPAMSRARTSRSNTVAGSELSIDCPAGGRTGSPPGRRDRRAGASPAAFAAKAATTTIPIVFDVAEDPVRLGLVASLARPGGNLTGVNFFGGELGGEAARTPA